VIEGSVASASPSLHRLVERVVSSLRETDRRLADEVQAHLATSPKLVEPDSEHVAQVEECLAVALASSPWADQSKDTVNPAGMPPSWVVHARFLLQEKAPPSSPPIPQADLRGPDRKPRLLSDEPLTEPIKHQWPALGGRPLIAGPIQPPAPPPLDPPGTVYLKQADDVKPAIPDARVQAVQAALDVVAEPIAEPIAAPIAQPTPCPKCNGTGRIGVPPVRFRCPECLGAGSLARP
jgi:hypothetical protein